MYNNQILQNKKPIQLEKKPNAVVIQVAPHQQTNIQVQPTPISLEKLRGPRNTQPQPQQNQQQQNLYMPGLLQQIPQQKLQVIPEQKPQQTQQLNQLGLQQPQAQLQQQKISLYQQHSQQIQPVSQLNQVRPQEQKPTRLQKQVRPQSIQEGPGPNNQNINTIQNNQFNTPTPQANNIPDKPTDTETILQSRYIQQLKQYLEDNRNVAAEYKSVIRDIEDNQSLIEEYIPHQYRNRADIQSRFLVLGQCKQFIRVRGDGNCFYSSFIYQYLKVILCDQAKDNYVNYLCGQLVNLQLQLFLQDNANTPVKFTEQESLEYIFAFNSICRNIRSTMNRLIYFDQLFKGTDLGFYYLCVLIFRNLFHSIFQHHQKLNDDRIPYDLSQELLTWEQECNCNELMIMYISNALSLQINVYICERTGAKIEKYNENHFLPQINIIFRAGHYQIAVP